MLKWFKTRLMPARKVNYDVVADLDAMLSEPVGFRLHGKVHVIKPLEVEQFMKLTAALSDVYDLQKKKGVTPTELVDRYYALIKEACGTVTKADIENMTQAQVGALFELVIETITGKIFADDKKKVKKMGNQLAQPQL